MKTLVYYSGGDVYAGCCHRTKAEIHQLKIKAKLSHVGYLIGHRYYVGQKYRVIVFFREEPTKAEVQQRRDNGFVGARWHNINI